MPGFMPGIHVLGHCKFKGVDGRNKSGHDDEMCNPDGSGYPSACATAPE
jgi:hypothetical protein